MRAFRLVPNVVLTGEVKEQAEGNEGGETSWGQTMTDSPMYLESVQGEPFRLRKL
jgi:hypothetical protein